MPSSVGLVTPSLGTFLSAVEAASSADTDDVDTSIQYLLSLLKRRQIRSSRACAIATARLLSLVVLKDRATDVVGLIKRVQQVGEVLKAAQPKELAVSNIVLRVTGVIRDEAEEDREAQWTASSQAGNIPRTFREREELSFDQSVQSSNPSTSGPLGQCGLNSGLISTPDESAPNIIEAVSNQPRPLISSQPSYAPSTGQPLFKSMFNLLSQPIPRSSSSATTPGSRSSGGLSSHPTDALANTNAAKDLRAEAVEAIEEIIEELNTADDQIAGYALEHIHSDEIILTQTYSVTVQKFLVKAASKRKFTVVYVESFPNEHESVHATVTGSLKGNSKGAVPDKFHKSLTTAGVTVILIPDSAVFAFMSRVNKVILGTHAVLADGSLVAAVGSSSIAKAAKVHKVPVVVLAAVYKLSPTPPFNTDTFFEFGDTSKIFSNEDADLIEQVEVENPLYDYVPSDLIDLYITNLGGHAPSYLYRIILDHYRQEDTQFL